MCRLIRRRSRRREIDGTGSQFACAFAAIFFGCAFILLMIYIISVICETDILVFAEIAGILYIFGFLCWAISCTKPHDQKKSVKIIPKLIVNEIHTKKIYIVCTEN